MQAPTRDPLELTRRTMRAALAGRGIGLFVSATLFVHCMTVHGDVFVFSNRTAGDVSFQVSPELTSPYLVRLRSGEVRPVWSDEKLQVAYETPQGRRAYLLDQNTAYYFGESSPGNVLLRKIGLAGDESTSSGRRLPGAAVPAVPVTLAVEVLVDDDEPTRRVLWEKKLRDRVAAASQVMEKHAGVRLRVVGVGQWLTDDATTDFFETLSEFEKQVKPEARLAIGFTSQYEAAEGRIHMGGTRGPTSRHIMIRESSRKLSERERLELLVHELGHFMGATHSPEPDSVMRPVLGDRRSRLKSFQVRFDPVNTLIIAMVGEEMRRRGIDRFHQLSRETKQRLAQVYGVVGETMPDDPAAGIYQQRVRQRPVTAAVDGTRAVLQAIVIAARRSQASGADGDKLTELLVRAAAARAAQLPDDEGPKAMLLALGIGIDDSTALRELPATREAVLRAETASLRRSRLSVLGKPTLEGRRDLAKHFFVAAHLVAATDDKTAYQLGLTKETLDAQGGSGFSFADLAADRAGIRFANTVLSGRARLEVLAERFQASLFMPGVTNLPEGLSGGQLLQQYGGPDDERFKRQVAEIDARINILPAYAVFDLPH